MCHEKREGSEKKSEEYAFIKQVKFYVELKRQHDCQDENENVFKRRRVKKKKSQSYVSHNMLFSIL